MVFETKNEVILLLTALIMLNNIGFWIEPFAIKVNKEFQLYPSLMLGREIPFTVSPDCGTTLFE